ncbi:BREX system P-loop protein BrxC [Sulfitobacter mediterraneus]|uniref:BREX system P-loop protein BrxC n=1 Tax=Sulfitobacter mediterraneus TaxID=83219 RepID=UPI001C7063F4|nr:BREX system P-loop protein BrxC [Sulfitobacter mediterraneus]
MTTMTQIRTLFDPQRGLQRSIEKVISYQASQEDRLKSEISEYIVTDSIDEQLEKLLDNIQAALESGSGHEVGVWVSGFYGSGKSSFTKYLGLALDDTVKVDGQPFVRHLNDRLRRPQTKALLDAVNKRLSAAVIMLDLASQQIAGATLAEVSTVLYYKVLQQLGYSRNMKVAALERKLKKDGRYEEFTKLFQDETGEPWTDYQNDELVVDSLLPNLAHQMYPNLFKNDQAFSAANSETIYLMDDRVREMIDVVRDETGKENIVFVIDEIGQYVGSQQSKILDLQGLAENIKNIGRGKVWILGTAQQTLTEDDPHTAINSPELFKLKDRFPISVELESSDIKEICFRRLLGKSAEGEAVLGKLFEKNGQALRSNTKLAGAKYYDDGFDKTSFTNLYPFLPAHFEILLRLLGALAKSTGGVGLRSAIKVLQDILVEGAGDQPPVADQALGWLATTVTLYDSLSTDIRRAFPSLHGAVDKVLVQFPDDTLTQNVAKTIAVLQILSNMPVTVENISALMHPSISSSSIKDDVKASLEKMLGNPFVPLGEKDGSLRFFSEKLNDVEQERVQLALRSSDVQRIFSNALRDTLTPSPATRLHGNRAVTSGVKSVVGGRSVSLAGDRETIQTAIVLADAEEYETERTKLLDESRQRSAENTIFLLGRSPQDAINQAGEIYRCNRIVEIYRNDPDQEVKEYCASQTDRAARLSSDLTQLITRSLARGSFVFRGAVSAVESIDPTLASACRKYLSDVAEQVYDRHTEAPERVETALPEKFLRAADANLKSITSQIDPMGLVQLSGGTPSIQADHKALVSIRDQIERNGLIEGKRLLETFADAPFGWSQDTTRYLISALLVGGEIKLKVGGREVTVNGQQAIEALKTNNSFKPVGVSLRDDRPSMDVLAKAAERLRDLSGDVVVPLEENICKAAQKLLLNLQHQYASLGEKLASLKLPGSDTMVSLNQQIADLLLADCSDAPQVFGAESSTLFDELKWAHNVRLAFDQKLDRTVQRVRDLQHEVSSLPKTGAPGELVKAVEDDMAAINDRLLKRSFFDHAADISTKCSNIETCVAETVRTMASSQTGLIADAATDLSRIPEWGEFTSEEQQQVLAELQELSVKVSEDIAGLKSLLSSQFDISTTIQELKRRIVEEGRDRRKPAPEPKPGAKAEPRPRRALKVPAKIATTEELEQLIQRLQELRSEAPYYEFDVEIGEE